ncbi:MAG: Holliday junction branch migration protein RuvA [Bacteroidetes bacterium]|nr:Holliday junction branch migration protein RuvA [Bacteroidota bacterium]MBT4728562.1 Holliday junction branch migration protein RuvA [Bacteroidota bacterium]MBT4970695.1 Holliday junction branch migration protein RuvA [Bacteroidota bacterium]MBT7039295.1 Holliday junction branch migration protein RuvA [Bacteroidota bacterium]MBT7995334.1 Holliday junction branch migration protein RuvA [Bacteroidota bacterium]
MFEYISGNVVYKQPTFVVIDINGLAYRINISLNTFESINNAKQTKLLLHQSIKEDSHTLYGFLIEDERSLFRSLISVSGIGTNTAILILSSFKTSEIINAIINANVSLLKSIKGVGPKTAQRMIVELQDSLGKKGDTLIPAIGGRNQSVEEAISALHMLGFKKNDAEKVIVKIVRENPGEISVEELIKLALKSL